jgi:hypothetical protein
MRTVNSVAAMSLFASEFFAPGVSSACGLPDDVALGQALLNNYYPKALFVTGATWEMQQEGVLPIPDRELLTSTGARRIELDEAARFAAIEDLELLGAHFYTSSRQRHAIAVVMLDRMHWARYLIDPATGRGNSVPEINCGVVERAEAGDLVVVTEDVVVHAIRTGNMSIVHAETLGILRLYGADGQIAAFISDFGEISSRPLSTEPRALSVLERFEALSASEVTQISIAPKETR